MALTTWADCLLSDLMDPLVDASLSLVQVDRLHQPVNGATKNNLKVLRSFTNCLGKTRPFPTFIISFFDNS